MEPSQYYLSCDALMPNAQSRIPRGKSVHFLFFLFKGGSPFPRMGGMKIANLLQQGYRMPKPEHVDDDL